MFLEIRLNKIILQTIITMKILKKKKLGTLEVYVIFLSCIYAGFIGYKSLLNVLFTWN